MLSCCVGGVVRRKQGFGAVRCQYNDSDPIHSRARLVFSQSEKASDGTLISNSLSLCLHRKSHGEAKTGRL